MKKQSLPILIVITLVFTAFLLGLYLGINLNKGGIQVSVPVAMQTVPPQVTVPVSTAAGVSFPVNLNTATKEELMALPGIGERLAQRILDYRQAVVLFSAPEELANIEGIGTKLTEEIRHLVTVGG